MSWAKFDDRYDDNRKVKRVWKRCPEAVGLHVMAVTYCARHETDGRVDADWIEDKLPRSTTRTRVIGALVKENLFSALEGGDYEVNDYLDFNESHEVKEERRKRDRERKIAAGRRGGAAGLHADSNGTPDGSQRESEAPVPTPTRPDPTPAPTTSATKAADPQISDLCHFLADKMLANDPKAKVAPESLRWLTDMRRLVERDERHPDEIKDIIEFAQGDSFWRSNILSPAKLRDKFPQLALKAKGQQAPNGQRVHPADAQVEQWQALGAKWAVEDGA